MSIILKNLNHSNKMQNLHLYLQPNWLANICFWSTFYPDPTLTHPPQPTHINRSSKKNPYLLTIVMVCWRGVLLLVEFQPATNQIWANLIVLILEKNLIRDWWNTVDVCWLWWMSECWVGIKRGPKANICKSIWL